MPYRPPIEQKPAKIGLKRPCQAGSGYNFGTVVIRQLFNEDLHGLRHWRTIKYGYKGNSRIY
jgi:hypothetical protein